MANGRHWTPERVAELRRAILAGMPVSEMMARFGRSRSSLEQIAWRRLSVTITGRRRVTRAMPIPGRPVTVSRAEVERMVAEGKATGEIARRLGCSRTSVRRARAALGISAPASKKKRKPAARSPTLPAPPPPKTDAMLAKLRAAHPMEQPAREMQQ